MSIQRRYRFTLTWDGVNHEYDPNYSGSVTESMTDGFMFYRREWGGKLRFLRDEAEAIIDADFETRFEISVEVQLVTGYYEEVFRGYFSKTDLDVDVDNRWVDVKPIALDDYTPIVEGKEKEIDLIEEDCPITSVNLKRKAAVQIYLRGTTGSEAAHEDITTIVGDNVFTGPITDPLVTSQQLQNDYHFAELESVAYIPPVPGLTPDVSGYYEIATLPTGGLGWRRLDSAYWLTNSLAYYPGVVGGTPPPSGGIGITDAATGDYVYETAGDVELFPSSSTYNERSPEYVSLTDPDSKCRLYYIFPFARLLCNADSFDGNPTLDLPETDIVESQLNYRKAAPLPGLDVTLKSQTRVDRSSLGKVPAWANKAPGEWHFQLLNTPTLYEVPLFADKWTEVSVWWLRSAGTKALIESVDEDVTIDHAFKLSDVVMTMANALGSSVSEVRSDFFYGTNPIRSGVEPFWVPRSNVAIANYDAPATKSPVKWTELETYLELYKCGWFIEDGTLRIEHISWFDNGGSYTSKVVGVDLTTEEAPKTGEKWAYGQNRYSYDKVNIPDQIEFDWSEDVGDFFQGEPIECVSAYVSAGQIETISLVPFISDIESVMLRDGALDGFVILECEEVSEGYQVAFLEIDYLGWKASIQNGHASLWHIHKTYHVYSAPCQLLVINGEDTNAESVQRNKVQQAGYPNKTIDPMKLVKTSVGEGKIRKREIDLITGHNKIELEHDTE